MPHNIWLLVLSMALAVPLFGQSVSDQLRQRTGYGLRDTPAAERAEFTLPPGVTLAGPLLSNDAVSIALWNNSALQADLAKLEVSRADLVEAGMFRNPSFAALFPVGPKPFEFLLAWPIEELWQRKQRVKTAKINLDVVAGGLVQNGLNLTRDVRVAHADLWLTEARSRILGESADLRARIAMLTERRRESGDGTGLDVIIARADSESIGQLSQNAASDAEVARARLRHLLGMRGISQPLSTRIDESRSIALQELEALLEMAFSNRPDLRAAEVSIEASAERAKWQGSQVIAMMAPTLSIKEVGTDGLRVGPGLNMEIPLLSRNQGRISRADAEVVQAGQIYVSLRDQVESEVVEARERVRQAETSIARIRSQVRPPINESIQITERAYRNGDVSLLNVLEATRARFDVDLREVEAQANLLRALADLERAVGRRL